MEYKAPPGRQISFWMRHEDVDYLGEGAAELGISRNQFLKQIIAEHRERQVNGKQPKRRR